MTKIISKNKTNTGNKNKINNRVIVTGGAGFIGSHLVRELLQRGFFVTVLDNFSNGIKSNLYGTGKHLDADKHLDIGKNLIIIKTDLRNEKNAINYIKDADLVFHLAANFSVKLSSENPLFDAYSNFISTLNVLEAMRRNDIPTIVFTSSSTVYGKTDKFPIPETAKTHPISNYGASKLSSEIYINTFSKLYGMCGLVLRYANIIGPGCNHGVVFDFVNKLRTNPKRLEILGDGKQKKSYLDVEDCVAATLLVIEKPKDLLKKSKESKEFKCFDVFNIGSNGWITVDRIADIVCSEMGLKDVEYAYTGGTAGWLGDVSKFILSTQKIGRLGWKPKYNIEQSIRRTVRWLEENSSP